jgi:ATP adenylyltransferase
MDKLWAPWRSKYVKLNKEKDCIFCLKLESKKRKNYIISRGEKVFSLLNIYPYNNGHVMVAPFRHVRDLDQLKDDELTELMKHTNKIIKKLKKVLRPDAFNVGLNLGKDAGAGFAGHLHIHIVPRWRGDTNFMPVIGKTKVIPQSLDELYKRLKKVK